jgi:predicted nucleic acid-binding protein
VRTTPKRAEDLHTYTRREAKPAARSPRQLELRTLLRAHRADMSQHADAAEDIRRLASSGEPWGVTTTTAAAFLRAATHRDEASPATPSHDAVAYLHELLALPNCRLLDP